MAATKAKRRRKKWREPRPALEPSGAVERLGPVQDDPPSWRDEFHRRVRIDFGDRRVGQAAHPYFHEAPESGPTRRGPREDVVFNACIVATADLIYSLIGWHDWSAITLGLVLSGWGPQGFGTLFGSQELDFSKRTEVDDRRAHQEMRDFRENIRNRYRKTVRRLAVRRRRIRPAVKRIEPALSS